MNTNDTSKIPQIGDLIKWPNCDTPYPITRISGDRLWVAYNGVEFDYLTSAIGDSFQLIKVPKDTKTVKHLTPQAHIVLRHLQSAGSITQREALVDHSVQSLTRRITELRGAGFNIKSISRKHPITGQRYARYTLIAA